MADVGSAGSVVSVARANCCSDDVSMLSITKTPLTRSSTAWSRSRRSSTTSPRSDVARASSVMSRPWQATASRPVVDGIDPELPDGDHGLIIESQIDSLEVRVQLIFGRRTDQNH